MDYALDPSEPPTKSCKAKRINAQRLLYILNVLKQLVLGAWMILFEKDRLDTFKYGGRYVQFVNFIGF
jgi:hypothetical protein